MSNAGRRVRVLFYGDGSYRFRVYETPLYLAECYVQGGRNDFSILKLVPSSAVQQAALTANGSTGDDESSYVKFEATGWWDPSDNSIHLGAADPSLRARHKPGSYTWRKLFYVLAERNPEMYDRNPEMRSVAEHDES